MYLAAAGVGTIGIVDFDVVDFSNLQRQIIHGTPDVGRTKLDSAGIWLHALNPHVDIQTYETALTSANAVRLFEPYDVILDGNDNFPTRYLTNDACVLLGKPNAYRQHFPFRGPGVRVRHQGRPLLSLLVPGAPAARTGTELREGGVLGVLPGVIGVIQATEAIKLVTGIGEPLIGRFLIYDALKMRFRELKLQKDPDCPSAARTRPSRS
jgi:adenylyltransferase/sulfurtransferase